MDDKEINSSIYSCIGSIAIGTPVTTEFSLEKAQKILDCSFDIFKKEPILLEIKPPIHIVGDLHGNYEDLLRIFQQKHFPPEEKYLFLGDFVDRGKRAVELLFLLFLLKIKFPDKIYLIRGNHETESVSSAYGFYDEVSKKYNGQLFYTFQRVFNCLPIAAVIGGKIFCIHGGLSPKMNLLSSFKSLKKPDNVDTMPFFVECLWSDPMDISSDFQKNDRGCGMFFSSKALSKFLEKNDLEIMIRAHEMCKDGYNFPYKNSDNCITVFSSSDYCQKKNKGAVLDVSEDLSIDAWVFQPLDQSKKSQIRITLPEFLLKEKDDLPLISDDLLTQSAMRTKILV